MTEAIIILVHIHRDEVGQTDKQTNKQTNSTFINIDHIPISQRYREIERNRDRYNTLIDSC